MIEEVIKSTRETLMERLTSPLLGSFTIAWCLWNYKFLVILFSDTGVTKTFELIKLFVFPNTLDVLMQGILYPLLSALTYVFIYPYPAKYIFEFTLRRQREINKSRQKIHEETLLTLEESRKIRSEHMQSENKYQEVIDRLNTEITRLKTQNNPSEETESPDPSPAEILYGRIEPTQLDLLKLLEKQGGKTIAANLLQASKESKIKVEFDVGELLQKKLINQKYDDRLNTYVYEFTHEGRRVLLNEGKLSA